MNGSSKSDTRNSAERNKRGKKELIVEIDLPGQPIQCWTTDVDKVTVILKKHRDVVC